MTDDSIELTRRDILGSVGAVGAAGAVAGLSTSALLSDQETVTNNQLVAGALDMKVAYSAYYSDWSDDEDGSTTDTQDDDVDVRMWNGAPETTGGSGDLSRETGFPTNDAWLIAVDDPAQFLTNTETVADGTTVCNAGTDDDDVDQPVIELTDVKPGDFGGVMFDISLCDNPGYLWLDGDVLLNRENGFTEPESDDPDEYSAESPPESGDASILTITNDLMEVNVSTDLSGSLAGEPWVYTFPDGSTESFLFFEIYTLRDDANRGETSIGDFDANFPPTGVPGTTYTGTYTTTVNGVSLAVDRTFALDPVDGLLTVEYRFENVDEQDAIDDLRFTQYVDYDMGEFSNTDTGQFRSDGSRNLTYVGQTELSGFGDENDLHAGFGATEAPTAHDVGNRRRVLNDVFSSVRLRGDDSHKGDVGFALEYSLGRLTPGETTTLTTAFAVAPSPEILKALLLKPRLELGGGDLADKIQTSLRYSGYGVGDEEVVFEGSLAHFFALAATGKGLPLDGGDGDFNEVLRGASSRTRDCFTASPDLHSLGFHYSLPVDHGNDLQGDSVAFEIGFYTEQCRHNDGSGMGNIPTK